MHWIWILALLPIPATLLAQDTLPPDSDSATSAATLRLPDSPGTVQMHQKQPPAGSPPCKPQDQAANAVQTGSSNQAESIAAPGKNAPPCPAPPDLNPYQRFLNSPTPLSLTPRQKGILAVRNVIDPANLFTITANAGFTVAIDAHTGYGPGLKGFGRDIGYSLVQDATGEFFSTFALASLFHQDPHYHRLPDASVSRRFVHAISHTIVSQHDDGTPMINYSTLLTYPISAEIANLYVPGIAVNGPSTVKRVAIGIASNPIDDLITEFLPDFARHIHIRVVFLQQILNRVSTGQTM